MLRNLFWKTLRDQRSGILGWSLGLIGLSFYLMYFYPYISQSSEILKMVKQLPPFIKSLIGNTTNLATAEGFFNIQPFSIMGPLIFLFYAISKGSDAVAGEEKRGTLELLMANPIPRWRVVIEKFMAHATAIILLAVAFWAGMVLGSLLFSISLNPGRLAEATISCSFLGITFYTLSLSVGCLSGKQKLSIGLSSGLAITTYLINAYAPMVKALQPYRVFSPFYYYNGNTPLINGIKPSHLLVQSGLSITFLLLSLIFFHRRDIQS